MLQVESVETEWIGRNHPSRILGVEWQILDRLITARSFLPFGEVPATTRTP